MPSLSRSGVTPFEARIRRCVSLLNFDFYVWSTNESRNKSTMEGLAAGYQRMAPVEIRPIQDAGNRIAGQKELSFTIPKRSLHRTVAGLSELGAPLPIALSDRISQFFITFIRRGLESEASSLPKNI